MNRYLVEVTRVVSYTHLIEVSAPNGTEAISRVETLVPADEAAFDESDLVSETKEAHVLPTSHDYPSEVAEDEGPLDWDSPGISEVKQMGRN
jgi:hypothetical protein